MLVDSNKKHDFIIALDEAIDRFSEYFIKKNPETFFYRGANLQFALERYLYFTYSHHPQLMRSFLGETNLKSNDCTLVMLANFMGGMIRYRPERFVQFIRKIKDLRLIILDFFFKISVPQNEISKDKILFFIEQEKFKNYFNPITSEISSSNWAYLIRDNLKLSKLSESQGFSYLQYSPFFRYQLLGKANKKLKKFRSLLKDFDALHKLLSRAQPKKIVLAEGNSTQHELINRVGKVLGIPVICIQQGWSPIVHTGFRHMSYDKMFVWGQGFADLLQKYNPEQKFIVTGSHMISPAKNKTNSEKAITFFVPNNQEYIKYDRIITSADLEFFCELIRWTAKEFSEYLIKIREHPGAPLSEYEKTSLVKKNVIFIPQSNSNLDEVLAQTTIGVTFHSTLILECAAYNIPTLIINPATSYKFEPDTMVYGLSKEAATLEQAKEMLLDMIENTAFFSLHSEGKNRFNETFFPYDKEEAVLNILKHLKD
jgi:hypothetical protein